MATIKALHVRRLVDAGRTIDEWLSEQIEHGNEVFQEADLRLDVRSDEFLPTEGDGVIHVEECDQNLAGTAKQRELFDNVSGIPPNEIIVFIVRDFGPWKGGGCAWHPPERLGCMVTVGSVGGAKWKVAHELGHVFGLPHHELSTMLMYPSVEWSRKPPLLDDPEIAFLRGIGPAPAAPVLPSLALSEDSFRHELSKMEPSYRILLQYGNDAVQLLRRIYETSEEVEYKARATYALSLLSSDVDDVLADAAHYSSAEVRRAAADAAAKLLPNSTAEQLLAQLSKDSNASVRYVAARYMSLKSPA